MSSGSQSPVPAPIPGDQVSTLQRLLTILDIALKVSSGIVAGPVGGALSMGDAMLQIAEHANAVYLAEQGQPIDFAKIPPESTI
jgi:hypothetical protein